MKDNIRRERTAIHIVGSSLKGLTMDREFFDAIEKQILKGVELKILIGHPAFTPLRAMLEGRDAEGISKEISETLTSYLGRLRNLRSEKIEKNSDTDETQIEIKVALSSPTLFAIFLVGQGMALLNPYTYTIEAYNSPCFIIRSVQTNKGCIYEQYYRDHFYNAWYSSNILQREIAFKLSDPRVKIDKTKKALEKFDEALKCVLSSE